MDKIIHIKIASILLFWFGVIAQLITVFLVTVEYTIPGRSYHILPIFGPYNWVTVQIIAYVGFAHFIHIVAAYWLSKGRKKGIVLGLGISLYEIIPFLNGFDLIDPTESIYSIFGLFVRALFAVIIFLMISGRKELVRLQSENWRPWKNPKTTAKTFS